MSDYINFKHFSVSFPKGAITLPSFLVAWNVCVISNLTALNNLPLLDQQKHWLPLPVQTGFLVETYQKLAHCHLHPSPRY